MKRFSAPARRKSQNLAVQYLTERNLALEDYDGHCGELVDDLIHWLGEDRVNILYVAPTDGFETMRAGSHDWSYHMVAVVDGTVHDAWFPNAMYDPSRYVKAVFAGRVRFEVIGSQGPLPADVAFKV